MTPKTWLKLWKLRSEGQKLREEMERVDAEARKKNDPRIAADWYGENQSRLMENNIAIATIKTQDILKKAKKHLLTVPPVSDADKWSLGDFRPAVLKPEAMTELSAAIQKARRGSTLYLVQVIGGIIAVLTGLILLISYIRSFQKTVERKDSSQSMKIEPVQGQPPAVKNPEHASSAIQLPQQSARQTKKNSPSKPTPTVQINSAPGGIVVGGGTANNPTVYNYAPPQRVLTPEQKAILLPLLKAEAPQELYFVCAPDPESQTYFNQLNALLTEAGWKLVVHPYNWGTVETYPFGLEIMVGDLNNAPRGAIVLQTVFKQVGIEANGRKFEMVPPGKFALFIGMNQPAKPQAP